MKINENTTIIGQKVILVPYKECHVPKYNNWMQSPELQRLTASEPLTLDQEYEMQKSWLLDNSKCTFIILDRQKYDETQDEVCAMIGDTNLFFLPSDDDFASALVAEVEIMIAEVPARGKKCGLEAVQIMLQYGIIKLGILHFVAKISYENLISIRMFSKLGFKETSRSDIFEEVTLERLVDEEFKLFLSVNLQNLVIKD